MTLTGDPKGFGEIEIHPAAAQIVRFPQGVANGDQGRDSRAKCARTANHEWRL